MSDCELWLLRHARAEDFSPDGRDRSRPLHAAGRQACSNLNLRLVQTEATRLPEQVLVSPAARTRETAELVLNGLDLPVHVDERLWLASAGDLQEIAEHGLTNRKRLMLIAHNPGLENLARILGGVLPVSGFKPGTLVVLGLDKPLTQRPAQTLQVLEAREST